MKLCSLELGDTILIKILSENKIVSQFTSICWPSNQVEQSQISFNKSFLTLNGLTNSQLVFVQKYTNKKTLVANEIDIEYVRNLSSINLFNSESFELDDANLILGFLKEIYLNKTILVGQNLILTYMGQILVFKVIYIDYKVENKKLNTKKLVDKLEKSLNLNETNSETAPGLFETNFKDDLANVKYLIDEETCLYSINNKTKFNLVNNFDLKPIDFESPIDKGKKISFDSIGGLDKEIQILKELFVDQFQLDDLYKQIGKLFLLFL